MSERKVTILVVDDSDIIRHSLKNFFGGYNFEVISCINGLEGVQKANEHIPDLIFLDLMMPNFNGMKMLRVIKVIENLKKIPIIVISGNTSKANVLAALEAGADRVISKPLQKQIIMKNIKELLGDNFLRKIEKIDEPIQDDKEFLEELCKLFMEQYPSKKEKMLKALEEKDKVLLSSVAHEMKGAGGSIGYMDITNICIDIEAALRKDIIDWDNVKNKCEQFFSVAEKIEISGIEIEK
jgi:CheY-like chemotaxis protein